MADDLHQMTINAMDMSVDSRQCSRHPALVTAGGAGLCVVVFAAPFSQKPLMFLAVDMGTDSSFLAKIQSWQMDGNGNYTGCTLAVRQTRTLPGVLVLLSALLNYDTTVVAPDGVGLQLKAESAVAA